MTVNLQQQARQALQAYKQLPQRYGTAFHVSPPWSTTETIPVADFSSGVDRTTIDPTSWLISDDLISKCLDTHDTYLNWHLSHIDSLGIQTMQVPAGQTWRLQWQAFEAYRSQVIWITVEEGASLEIIDIAAGQIAWLRRLVVVLKAQSRLQYWALRGQQKFANEHVRVYLAGPEATVQVTQLSVGSQQEQQDWLTTVTHEAPSTTSRMTFRAAGWDSSQTIFRGLITVQPTARGAAGYQQGRALLLSPQTVIDMLPELAIATNEVRCSHGVSTLHLDETALFYLRSRGLPLKQAEELAIRGFFHQALEIPAEISQKLELWLSRP